MTDNKLFFQDSILNIFVITISNRDPVKDYIEQNKKINAIQSFLTAKFSLVGE